MCYGCYDASLKRFLFGKRAETTNECLDLEENLKQQAVRPHSVRCKINEHCSEERERGSWFSLRPRSHCRDFFFCALFHIIRIFKHSAMWTFPGPVDVTLETEVNMDVTHVSVSIWTLLCDQCRSIWSLCRPLSPGADAGGPLRADLRWWNSSDQQHCFYSIANFKSKCAPIFG